MNKNVLVTYRVISFICLLLIMSMSTWAFFRIDSIFTEASITFESAYLKLFVWIIIFSAIASFFVAWRTLLSITIMSAMQKDNLTEDNLDKLKSSKVKKEKNTYEWKNILTEDTDKLLHNLCRTLDLDLGRLFRQDENGNYINISNYAYIPDDFNINSFRKGDGLIGQVAINNKGLHIKDIPENYLKIVSASGNISPKNVYILPITIDNESKMIFELADMIKNGDEKYEALKEFATIFTNHLNNNK